MILEPTFRVWSVPLSRHQTRVNMSVRQFLRNRRNGGRTERAAVRLAAYLFRRYLKDHDLVRVGAYEVDFDLTTVGEQLRWLVQGHDVARTVYLTGRAAHLTDITPTEASWYDDYCLPPNVSVIQVIRTLPVIVGPTDGEQQKGNP